MQNHVGLEVADPRECIVVQMEPRVSGSYLEQGGPVCRVSGNVIGRRMFLLASLGNIQEMQDASDTEGGRGAGASFRGFSELSNLIPGGWLGTPPPGPSLAY